MHVQKDKFQLEADVRYINCAYMSPLLKTVEQKGEEGLRRKRNPFHIGADDYFDEVIQVRQQIAALIQGNVEQIALIPSVSYGFAIALNNIPYVSGQKAVVVADEFPSGYLSAQSWCKRHGADLEVIHPDQKTLPRSANWNAKLLASIDKNTAFVLVSSVHWMDGTQFDLKNLGDKCKQLGVKLLVDGTQGVGATPLDLNEIHLDGLFCAGYKWLMGPYGQGFAYFGSAFLDGQPLEESWMNRSNARDFAQLANYGQDYMPGAGRFNVGQTSDFIKIPMVNEALRQLNAWGVENIQRYCHNLLLPLVDFLKENEFPVEDEGGRAAHLMGFYLPERVDRQQLVKALQQEKIYLSFRGDSIRVSPHVYNTPEDISCLIEVLKNKN